MKREPKFADSTLTGFPDEGKSGFMDFVDGCRGWLRSRFSYHGSQRNGHSHGQKNDSINGNGNDNRKDNGHDYAVIKSPVPNATYHFATSIFGPKQPWAIDPSRLLELIKTARQQERIEPYQASLLFATNIAIFPENNEFESSNWSQFMASLVEMHNAQQPPFTSKRRALQRLLIASEVSTYEEMKDAKLMDNYDHPLIPDYIDSEEDVYRDPFRNIEHDRKPVSKFDPEKKIPGKYYAIPKDQMMPLIENAMTNHRMSYIQAAIMLSVNCHSLETRNSGQRYLDHVMAVAGKRGLTTDQQVVALLHDVIENSDYTFDDLRRMQLPERIVTALEHISKRPDETVYLKFIERCALNDDALAVKIADIQHNSTDAKESKRDKYAVALAYLKAIRDGEIERGFSIGKFANDIGYTSPSLFIEEKKSPKIKKTGAEQNLRLN